MGTGTYEIEKVFPLPSTSGLAEKNYMGKNVTCI